MSREGAGGGYVCALYVDYRGVVGDRKERSMAAGSKTELASCVCALGAVACASRGSVEVGGSSMDALGVGDTYMSSKAIKEGVENTAAEQKASLDRVSSTIERDWGFRGVGVEAEFVPPSAGRVIRRSVVRGWSSAA